MPYTYKVLNCQFCKINFYEELVSFKCTFCVIAQFCTTPKMHLSIVWDSNTEFCCKEGVLLPRGK